MTKAERSLSKARSPPASMPFKGQVTEQTTVKWSIVIVLQVVNGPQSCVAQLVKKSRTHDNFDTDKVCNSANPT